MNVLSFEKVCSINLEKRIILRGKKILIAFLIEKIHQNIYSNYSFVFFPMNFYEFGLLFY